MPGVVASCPRLWLVSSHDRGSPPGPGVIPYRVSVYEDHQVLLHEINASFAAESTMGFAGLSVTLYVRHPGAVEGTA